MDIDEDRRFGRFTVSIPFLIANKEVIMQFMGMCIPLEVCTNYANDTMEYFAYSPLFRPTKLGDIIPKYSVIFNEDGFIFNEIA